MLDHLVHPVHRDRTPWLDRTGPEWLGCFPGLGTVRVAADGSVTVDVVDGPAPDREQALRHGWGEPLALARLGLHLARGTTLADGGRAVLVTGSGEETGRLVIGLLADGWALLADGLCPLREGPDGGWAAAARPGPLLVRRRVAHGAWSEGRAVRGGTDAVAVRTAAADGAPAGAPAPLAGVLHVRRCGRDEPVALLGTAGADRLRQAADLLVGGVLAQPADAAGWLRRHRRLAEVPAATLAVRPGTFREAMALVRAWIALSRASPSPTSPSPTSPSGPGR